jgi:hypothetical protein
MVCLFSKMPRRSGGLPPAHLDARARRYAVKIFLSHLYAEWRKLEGMPVYGAARK